MANTIKYSTGSESLALKKGNWWIGTGDVGKGPTSITGYYNGITPPSGGYTIYLNKATGGPSIYTCANDTELIGLTNSISGSSYTTANECFNYYQGQDDKMILNRDIEAIVTDGLVLNLDAGLIPSYPRNGNTLYDLTGNYTGMSLYGNTSYGSISNGVVNLSASGNADANGCILRSTETISTTLNSDFTTTGWLYRTTSNSAELMSYRETWTRLSFEILDNGIYFNQRETVDEGGDGSYNIFQTSVSVTNSRNVWEHFTLSKSGTQWSFYKNGEHIGTNTFSMTETVSGAGFHIGAAWSDDDYLGRGMNGKVGPVMHYTRLLSSDEVLQNYNAQKSRFGL